MIMRIWENSQPTNRFINAETGEIVISDYIAELWEDRNRLGDSKSVFLNTGFKVGDLS